MKTGSFLATVLIPMAVVGQLPSPPDSNWLSLATTNQNSEAKFKCKKVIGNWSSHSLTARDVVLTYTCAAGTFKKSSIWVTVQKPPPQAGPKPLTGGYTPVKLNLKRIKEPVTIYVLEAGKFCVFSCGIVKGKHQLMIMGKVTLLKDLKTTAKTFGDEFVAPFFSSAVQYQ